MVGRSVVVWAVLAACAELPPLEPGTCGNGVVETGEDCDSAVDPALGTNLACGASRGEHACRYTCRASSCPVGWGCGEDGLCRYGTGAFAITAAIALPHDDLAIGDIDGARGGELVAFGAAGARVAFGERVAIVRGPDPLARPTGIGDLDGDDRMDLVVGVGAGIGVWRGEPDGSLSAVGYAPFPMPPGSWMMPLRIPRVGSPEPVPDAIVLLKPSGTGTAAELLLSTTASTFPITSAVTPGALGPIAVRSDLDAPSPADELVIAAAGQREAWIVAPRVGPETAGLDATPLQLPDGEVSDGRVAASDVDGDGDIDLLFGTVSTSFGLRVAFDDGAWTFRPTSTLDALNRPNALPGVPQDPQPFPLAVGDLDGDGALDAVSPDAVFLTRAGMLEPVFRRFSTTPWREAIIANVDAGPLDVVVADGPRLTVLRQSAGPAFTAISIDTVGSVTNLRAGDFDGDGLGDVLFRERTTRGDQIRVLFGAHDALTPPLTVLRTANALRIEVGRIGSPFFDGADDIAAVIEDRGVSRAAVITGAGDRRLASPLVLASGGPANDLAIAATTGHFLGPQSTGSDLVVVGWRANAVQLWLFRATEGAAFSSFDAGIVREPQLDGFAISRLLAADLRGDGTDELIVLGVAATGETELVIIDFDVDGPPRTEKHVAAIGQPLDLAAGDLDRDGRLEVVAVGEGGVVILRRDVLEPIDRPATSAAIAQLDRDPAAELVLLERDSLAILDGATLAREHGVAVPAGATLVRAGDLDGDGVADLAVGDGLGVLRLIARSQLP